MSKDRFEFGDRIRHTRRPEWGIGSVVRAEEQTVNGAVGQRLQIRFPGAGLKTLNTLHAQLERIDDGDAGDSPHASEPHPLMQEWDRLHDEDWLQPLAQRRIREGMVKLPDAVSDPFRSGQARIKATLELFRFDRTGRSLIDWAVAQTGLDDPLSRFSRHELEQFFDRWAFERDTHLHRLLVEEALAPAELERLLDAASPEARRVVQRGHAVR